MPGTRDGREEKGGGGRTVPRKMNTVVGEENEEATGVVDVVGSHVERQSSWLSVSLSCEHFATGTVFTGPSDSVATQTDISAAEEGERARDREAPS